MSHNSKIIFNKQLQQPQINHKFNFQKTSLIHDRMTVQYMKQAHVCKGQLNF